jgi:hypothetical protein
MTLRRLTCLVRKHQCTTAGTRTDIEQCGLASAVVQPSAQSRRVEDPGSLDPLRDRCGADGGWQAEPPS